MKLKELIEQLTNFAEESPDYLDADIVAAPLREFSFGGYVGNEPEQGEERIEGEFHKLPSPFEQFKIITLNAGLTGNDPNGAEKYVVFGFDADQTAAGDPEEFVN